MILVTPESANLIGETPTPCWICLRLEEVTQQINGFIRPDFLSRLFDH